MRGNDNILLDYARSGLKDGQSGRAEDDERSVACFETNTDMAYRAGRYLGQAMAAEIVSISKSRGHSVRVSTGRNQYIISFSGKGLETITSRIIDTQGKGG